MVVRDYGIGKIWVGPEEVKDGGIDVGTKGRKNVKKPKKEAPQKGPQKVDPKKK